MSHQGREQDTINIEFIAAHFTEALYFYILTLLLHFKCSIMFQQQEAADSSQLLHHESGRQRLPHGYYTVPHLLHQFSLQGLGFR